MDDDDCYIVCGTALPDPEDVPSAQKRANRELQVRDEKGRQRFHGAFTGGFSAGYFNTVGTKEGWAPSTFVSSRSKAAERIKQNPEDFMDTEDFSEFGIAPRTIHTTVKFRDGSVTSGKRKVPSYSDSVIPGEPPLKELVQPVVESIGIQILMKMGWKPGQGIGPRVKKGMKRTGGFSTSMDSNTEADDPTATAFTFAPQDAESLPYTPKNDYHGIGYTGLSTQSVLNAPSISVSSNVTKSWLEKSKKKLLISGKAFGIGALEDDDDIDVYSHEDMSQYDFSEFAVSQKPTKETEIVSPGSTSSSGGVLDGFVQSEKSVTVRKRYPLPQLPPSYTPVRRSEHAPGESEQKTSKFRQVLTAEDRSLILGERKFTMSFGNTKPLPTCETLTPVNQSNTGLPSSTKTVSSGFQPFVNDPQKQKRYEEYLKLNKKECFKALQPVHLTEWEKQQELEEFAGAASLYQPLSKMLSTRFVSRSHLEVENQGGIVKVEKSSSPSPGNAAPSGPSHEKIEWHPSPLLCKRFNIPNPYPNSSSVGVPNSGRKQTSLFDCLSFKGDTKSASVSDTQETVQEEAPDTLVKIEPEESQKGKGSEDKDFNAEEPSVCATEELAPGVRKPPMDLFKAIFENTSDEEEEESIHSDQVQEEEQNSSSTKPLTTTVPSKQSSSSVTSPPPVHNKTSPKKGFGVFANLDLDKLSNSWTAASDINASTTVLNNESAISASEPSSSHGNHSNLEESHKDQSGTLSESFYGPQLPPSGITSISVDPKTRSRKHSRRKEKHKHHKHKKKKSKKQKKKKSTKDDARSSSISSNSSDCDDIDPLTIIKKLDDLHNKTRKKHDKY